MIEFGPIPHKSGVLCFNGGSVFEGDFHEGQRTGHGKLNYANENEYSGQFICGKKEGYGKFCWVKGESYDGEFKNDRRTGFFFSFLFSFLSFFFFFNFIFLCFLFFLCMCGFKNQSKKNRTWCLPLDQWESISWPVDR